MKNYLFGEPYLSVSQHNKSEHYYIRIKHNNIIDGKSIQVVLKSCGNARSKKNWKKAIEEVKQLKMFHLTALYEDLSDKYITEE